MEYSTTKLTVEVKQGWVSTTGATTGSGSTIKIDLSEKLTELRKNVDLDNIAISEVRLYINCASVGADRKKLFRLKLYNGSTVVKDYGSKLESNKYAYGQTTYLNLGTSDAVLSWLKKGTKITSTDPQAGGTLHFTSNSNDKLTYSYNYVKITSVYLYIEYTILGSTLTNYNDTMVVNKSYDFSISGVNTYYHNLTLKAG